MKKPLGDKRKLMNETHIYDLSQIYLENKESKYSKIYPNHFFGYTKVVVEQPLIENGSTKIDRQNKKKN